MERKIKNQILPVLKRACGSYQKLEYEVKNSLLNDYSINIYQLDTEGRRTNTLHSVDDICAVATVFKVHCYVTTFYETDKVCVHLF